MDDLGEMREGNPCIKCGLARGVGSFGGSGGVGEMAREMTFEACPELIIISLS